MVKVIASSVRKGNVIEKDGTLYAVIYAENVHPGKGTPTTKLEMRRISDGVKTVDRYKTTDQVEKAFVDEMTFTYLYDDGDGFVFMNPESYEQVTVGKDILGDQASFLQESMDVTISLHNAVPIALQLPQRVVLEVIETEPVIKGQTASSSFKPAVLSNGMRTTVPHHIAVGTRIVVMTDDASYVERAKD